GAFVAETREVELRVEPVYHGAGNRDTPARRRTGPVDDRDVADAHGREQVTEPARAVRRGQAHGVADETARPRRRRPELARVHDTVTDERVRGLAVRDGVAWQHARVPDHEQTEAAAAVGGHPRQRRS